MKKVYCDICRNIAGRIQSKRGFVCWSCYDREIILHDNQDWRDKASKEHAENNDITQRQYETDANFANRCKRLALEGLKKLNKT